MKSLGPRARFSVVVTQFTFLLLLSIRLSYFSGKQVLILPNGLVVNNITLPVMAGKDKSL